MAKKVTVLRVFVASPGDVKEEREILEDVINELNLLWQDQLGVILQLVKWETHVTPGISTDAQAVINEQISDNYDIFIGILWTRFGTPTGRAISGTEEEFERAYAKWEANPNEIRIMLYFKTAPISPEQIDPEQLARVNAFRKRLGEKGVLYRPYATLEELSSLLRFHLSYQVQGWMKSWGTETKAPQLELSKERPSATLTPSILARAEDEEGFIEFIERIQAESERAQRVIVDLGQSFKSLSSKVNEAANEINSLTGDNRSKLAAYKRISNRVADVMGDFTARMRPQIPILKESLSSYLDAFGRAISMMPEFGLTDANVEMIKQALEAITTLKPAILSNQESITSLRNTIAKLPRMTTQFNRAKREILDVLDSYLATVESALNLIPEIEKSIRNILDSKNTKGGEGVSA